MTISDSSTTRAIAQRLLAPGMPEHGTADAMVTGVDSVFAHLFHTLSQWIGATGCHTLFARAIALSARHHPVLTGVRYQLQSAPHFDHLSENAREYGSQAIAEGATTVLATIITILAGLIGEDMTMSLLEDVPTRTSKITSAIASGTASDTASGLTPHRDDGAIAS